MIVSTIFFVYLFVLGAILGSFYNVVGIRIPKNQSIVFSRSVCPVCHKKLKAIEMIPLLSYIVQKGKCKSCRTAISPLYPFIEFSTAFLFMISPLLVGWSNELIISLSLISFIMIVVIADIKYMIIPDAVNLFFLLLFAIERILIPLNPWWDPIAGLVAGGLLPLMIILISKGGLGGGDMKLLAVLGLILGWKLVLLCFFLATLVGTVAGLIGMSTGHIKKNRPFPFGPFIGIGALIAYFFGKELIDLYIHFLHTAFN
ncbi:prepilin peptidase [Bacillus sp. SA1-12]|uniref:prepilin peptidase n=1 Tax=Bacillus sp. SA1-12 TaxID=1455638 RepID=UPI0006269E13|nr:A24 family peptidase [Bacillus sp. SA1-12]KKI92301.1 prepilin peptidase [Bacillus sp. SA1-12]